jgi:hypothetical protein
MNPERVAVLLRLPLKEFGEQLRNSRPVLPRLTITDPMIERAAVALHRDIEPGVAFYTLGVHWQERYRARAKIVLTAGFRGATEAVVDRRD